jgi:hypothetical protein
MFWVPVCCAAHHNRNMPDIEWLPVASSVLEAVAYRRRALWARFRTGEVCRYRGVPPRIFQELLNADSIGGYFNRHIRNTFPFDRLAGSFAA